MAITSPPPSGLAADQVSYTDLYERWERGNWSATELDFSEDRRQWREVFTDFERQAALWNYALFFWGEDAVADNLSPYIDAAPREEQKYFLTTQQVDEARHAVFFTRFMHEVCDIGDGSPGSGLQQIRPLLTTGFMRVFGKLDTIAEELRRDRSRPKLAAAVTLYHFLIEASLAQTGQHFISSYLEERDLLPGFREGMANVAADEQRHIAFGVKLLADLNREDERCAGAVAGLLREVLPWMASVLKPPGWDESYVSCFGTTFDELGIAGVTSLETKLRSAGLPLDELPGRPVLPLDLSPLERSRRGRALAMAGYLGDEDDAAPSRDAESIGLLFDTIRRTIRPGHGFGRPVTLQWKFSDGVEPWHLHVDNGSSYARPGVADHADVTLSCRFDDWVAITFDRLDPRRALLTGRLRPRGSLRVLAKLPAVFGP
jgi:hypothetical protein